MISMNLFFDFFKTSFIEVRKNKNIYLKAFFALIFLENLESIGLLLGVVPESHLALSLTIISAFLGFIVISQVVLIQKKIHSGVGAELKYFVPTFLLYHLYYSFVFLIGLFFFIVPGVYALIFLSLVPFVAVLDDNVHTSYFKRSITLVKKNIGLVAWMAIANFCLELSVLVIYPIQNLIIKAIANLIYSIPDAFLTIVMTVVIVKIYYFLESRE